MSCAYSNQNCYYNCCDVYGLCPKYSYQCHIYYSSNDNSLLLYQILGTISSILFIIALICICRRCLRARQESSNQSPVLTQAAVLAMSQQNLHQAQGNPNQPQGYQSLRQPLPIKIEQTNIIKNYVPHQNNNATSENRLHM